ncbi:MAG: hypothetical protein EA379_03495 [Phycisphaerales bacterium]|nr:MAG: hypothetical protein EA379_03495 [Phycisphaerales bacterium]
MSYRRLAGGFTLLDLLVSIVVIGLLLAIVLPLLAQASEATKRVVCRSNVRQIGITLALYAESHNGRLPQSIYATEYQQGLFMPQEMLLVRTPEALDGWDGLGRLFIEDYIATPQSFYCPSHRAGHTFDAYESAWIDPVDTEIVTNYHYRAIPSMANYLYDLDPGMALIADGMRSISDYNHKIGSNVLRADLSVRWFEDTNSTLASSIPLAVGDSNADVNVALAWWVLDTGESNSFPGLPWSPNPNHNAPSGLSARLAW